MTARPTFPIRRINPEYLSVHPATMAWWDRRETCETCQHLMLREGDEAEVIMRCAKVPQPGASQGRAYCIDARDEDGLCGPQARMYERRV